MHLHPDTTNAPRAAHSPWPEWCTLSCFAALVAFAIPYHEPWVDEAQGWQLSRTLSLHDLFQTFIRYEASPGLWHFLLWILNCAHVSYAGLHWVCGAIAVAAASLLIFKSPLPRYLKLTLPFTYFLVFQYAVVARNYVLVPPLLFMVAICWKKRPLLMAVLLGLLVNASLHAAVIAAGLALVYVIGRIRCGDIRNPGRRSQLLLFSLILLCFCAFALWTAWPPHDFLHRISDVRGQSRSLIQNAVVSVVEGICQPWFLSIPFWIAIALCFRARRSLMYLLPVLLFAAFSGAVHVNWWHAGLLVPLVICLAWITWPAPGSVSSRYELAGRAALAVMIATQILWSGYAIAFDHYHAYSPDRAAAEFLRPYVQHGATIAVTDLDDPVIHSFDSIGILPYFDHNIFINLPYPFWWWSDRDSSEERFKAVLPSHPRIVVVEITYHGPQAPISLDHPKYRTLFRAGYRFTNLFCGTVPERIESAFTNCHVIFQYPDSPPVPVDPPTPAQAGP